MTQENGSKRGRPAFTIPPRAFGDADYKVKVPEKESDLCVLFIAEMNQIQGWSCYPETAGFDILLVHESGRQIGVQAKLKLNAKVADQILPSFDHERYGSSGPDHRLVVVGRISDAARGIEKMLLRLGVAVVAPYEVRVRSGMVLKFGMDHLLKREAQEDAIFTQVRLFDWNPVDRCKLPGVIPNLPAGVPSPVSLTPWKQSAVKMIALMRKQGYITVKQISELGMASSRWTQHTSTHHSWLEKGRQRGQWVETKHMPAFDQQHPDLYQQEVARLDSLVPEGQGGTDFLGG